MGRINMGKAIRKQYSVPKNWTECYKLPLHLDDYGSYAWDADGNIALSSFDLVYDENGDFASGESERINHILDIINGECPTDYEAKWTTGDDDTTEIYYDGKFQFLVRGWGHLTGCGGLNLPEDLAAKIQGEFIAYILGKLNGSNGVK